MVELPEMRQNRWNFLLKFCCFSRTHYQKTLFAHKLLWLWPLMISHFQITNITQVTNVVKAVRKENRDIPIWIGETSSSYGGGADGLSNTYVAGFMWVKLHKLMMLLRICILIIRWLDKLGISAAYGVDNVFRQTLIQGNYALLRKNFDPNPVNEANSSSQLQVHSARKTTFDILKPDRKYSETGMREVYRNL